MRKFTLLRLGAIFFLAISSFDASAVIINGANYFQYTGSGAICPSGAKVYIYNGARYCRIFRANITWTIPLRRTNGAALRLSELKGYEIYWVRPSDNASGKIVVSTNTQTTTTFSVFLPTVYYFAMSAVDTAGRKSPLSTMVAANVNK